MKHRIIFVGVHNKPGKAPLDSSTLTGRTVDAIAAGLGDEFEIVKSNMHDKDYLPKERITAIGDWRKRVGYKRSDIVVGLGSQVGWDFARHHLSTILIEHISLEHPAKVMSHVDREQYIQKAIGIIKRKAKST